MRTGKRRWRRGGAGDLPTAGSGTPIPARSTNLKKPIYFIHGYSDNGDGFNARGSYWDNAISDYQYDGSPAAMSGPVGRIWTWCYYSVDTNCDLKQIGSRDTPIKDLGKDLAWDIYDRYSRYGIAVDVLGHSMGGLIIRAALTGVQRREGGFPPYIYVEDVTTLATPHRGSQAAAGCTFRQCLDMRQTSEFLAWLYDNPQGASGTDWTLVGFHDDLVAPVWSAVPDNMTSVGHRVIYDGGQFLPQISAHMSVLERTSGNYGYTYCDYFNPDCRSPGTGQFRHVASGFDPILMARYGNWSDYYF